MGDYEISVSLPKDSDGFLRRECPACEEQFKWFSHEDDDPGAEAVSQYFCPLCGVAADVSEWWTTDQVEFMHRSAGPQLDELVQDTLSDAFKNVKGLTFKQSGNFSFGTPDPDPLFEPDDMIIVEPPCHPNEPLKVPLDLASRVHCLVCGAPFST